LVTPATGSRRKAPERNSMKTLLLALIAALAVFPNHATAQQAADLPSWQAAFLDRIDARLDVAELNWPGRFAQVRAANGGGAPYGIIHFQLQVKTFRERLSSYRGQLGDHWLRMCFELAWEIEAWESAMEVNRLRQSTQRSAAGFRSDLSEVPYEAKDAERERLRPAEARALQRVYAAHRREGQRMAAVRRELVGKLKGLERSSFVPCNVWLPETTRKEAARFALRTGDMTRTGEGWHTWFLCEAPGAPDGLRPEAATITGSPGVGFYGLLARHPLSSIPALPVESAPPTRSTATGLRIASRQRLDLPGAQRYGEPQGAGPPAPLGLESAFTFAADLAAPVRGGIYPVEVRAGSDDRLLGSFELMGGCDAPIAYSFGPRPYLRRSAPSAAPLDGPLPEALRGAWSVSYQDEDLGQVSGRAYFSADGEVQRVRVAHPTSGESFVYDVVGFDQVDDGFELSLRGESPIAARGAASAPLPSYPDCQPIDVPAGERAIVFVVGDTRLAIGVAGNDPPTPDLNHVLLRLPAFDGTMAGEWSYAADRASHRDRAGAGRTGDYDPETGRVSGPETWTPLETKLLYIDVLTDQTGQRSPQATGARYPWGPDPASPRRFLAIYGEGLPEHPLDPHQLESQDPLISYSVHAWPSDRQGAQFARDWYTRAAESLAERTHLSSELRARLAKVVPLIVRAELSPGVLPHYARLTFDGRRAAWPLMFGGLGAGLDVVRKTGEVWEPLEYAYLPDQVALQLRLTVPLPIEAIPLELSELYDADRRRAAIFEGQAGPLRLYPVAGDPGLFRSPPIQLTSERRPGLALPPDGGVRSLALVDPEDSAGGVGALEVKLPERFQVDRFLLPVASEPLELGVRERPGRDGDWKRAVRAALTCREGLWQRARRYAMDLPAARGSLEVEDWDRLARETQDKLLEVNLQLEFLQTFGWPVTKRGEAIMDMDPRTETTITVGHYAAMLLLRQEFAAQLRDLLPKYRGLLSDPAAFESYRRGIAGLQVSAGHPLAVFEVSDPRGGAMDFSILTWPPPAEDPRFLEHWKLTRAQALSWHREQTRAVLKRMVSALEAAVAQLSSNGCDARDLLYSAAISYGPTARALLPRLVQAREVDGRTYWVADSQARAWVEAIPGLFRTAQLRRAESDLDSFFLNLQLAAVGLATAGSGSLLASSIQALDVGVALSTVVDEAGAYLDGRERTTLTRGAAALLGPAAYRAAEREARSLQAALFNTMLSAGGFLLPIAVNMGLARRPPRAPDAALVRTATPRLPRAPEGVTPPRSLRLADETPTVAPPRPGDFDPSGPTVRPPAKPGVEPGLDPQLDVPAGPAFKVDAETPWAQADLPAGPGAPLDFSPRYVDEIASPRQNARRPRESAPRTQLDGADAEPPPFTQRDFIDPLDQRPVRQWTSPDGRKFELRPLGQGNTARAYEVQAIDGQVPTEPLVLKTAQPNAHYKAEDFIGDLAHGADLLAEGDVPHMRFRKVVLAGDGSYVLQERAPAGSTREVSRADIDRIAGGERPEVSLRPEEQAAVGKLFDQLSSRNIAWADSHLENVYFFKQGGEVRAGVLDSDMIFEPGNVPSQRLSDMIQAQVLPPMDARGVVTGGRYYDGWGPRAEIGYTSAREFNGVAVQLKHWLSASPDGMRPGFLEPEVFQNLGFDVRLATSSGD
jgi:hypothetical protein